MSSFFLEYEYSAAWLGVIRISICAFLLFGFTFIIRDAWCFLNPNGIFGGGDYVKFCRIFPQYSIFNYYPNSIYARYIVVVFFYLSGLFSLFGLFTQFSLFVFLVCVISLQSRLAPLIYTAADSIVRSLLLCLMFTNCGAAFSLDVFLGRVASVEFVDGWAVRVFQVFICMVYFGAAVPKLVDRFWLSGEAVRNAALSPMWGKRFLMPLFCKYTKGMAVGCLIYEYFAPIFLMIKETALSAVIFGVFFHAGIAIFLRVGCFGPVMCISLLFFINPC